MAWLESHQALDRHPKIVMLKARMRWSQNETIGFVHRLWWLVLEYAPTSGDLRALPPMVVGELLGMKESDVAKAIEHMVEVGLIDKVGDCLYINDWNKITPDKRRTKKEYRKWRASVLNRDNNTCMKCGKFNVPLHVHHILCVKDHPDLITDVSNGVTLCVECHKGEHGKGWRS